MFPREPGAGYPFSISMILLSVDLEDYFMVSAFESVVRREDWPRFPPRIEKNTHRILDLLEEIPFRSGMDPKPAPKATFFCLGWVADRFPQLIREIHSRGHEIACHGYNHRMIFQMADPEEFRDDLRRSRAILEDIVGEPVVGYRAPSYSITKKTLWALRILLEEGFLYDSSIFPIQHDRYGIPDAPRFPFLVSCNGVRPFPKAPKALSDFERTLYKQGCSVTDPPSLYQDSGTKTFAHVESGTLLEIPLTTVRFMGRNLPVAGGGYFRLLPFCFTRWVFRETIRRTGGPFVFYIHPWELDPDQPRVERLPLLSRVRHYLNLDKTEERMKRLLLQADGFTCFRSLCLGPGSPGAQDT